MKKITIITPSFNQGHFLEQTIDSVLSQQYPNLEYMIVDGGSTDNSAEIIKKYEKHLAYWVSEKDNGQSDAINKGLRRATGDIINWLNSDDYYCPNALHTVAKYFEEEPILALAGKSNIWKNNSSFVSPGTDIYTSVEKTIGGARIDQPETFFSKSAIERIGSINTRLHYVMDKEWWIRYLLNFGLEKIKKTEDVLVNFRIHEHSKTSNFQDAFYQETINVYYTLAKAGNLREADVFEQYFNAEIIPGIPVQDTTWHLTMQKAIHYFWFFQGCMHYAQNNYPIAMIFFQHIKQDFLEQQDRKTIQKIKMRMKLLPVFIKKILNR